MSADPVSRLVCAKCGSPNPPGAAFCANCGGAMSAAPEPPPAPPPSAWPRAPAVMGQPQVQTVLAMDGPAAYAAARAAAAAVGKITGEQPPHAVQFDLVRRSFWLTLGTGVRYRVEAAVTPSGPRESLVRMTARIDWSSASVFLGVCGVAGLLAATLNPAITVALLAAGGFSVWYLASPWAKSTAERANAQLQNAMASSWPAPAAPRPAAAPPPVSARPSAPAAAAAADADVAEALRRLKALKDENLIDDAEYATKRSQLLARL